MENKGLLFIPDISGFTRFVTETEIEHSRMIVQELLEGLINSNQLGLEISEIEGDAILFYKYGEPPSLVAIYRQVETMFRAFHRNLNAYDLRKYCQCRACVSAAELTLKIITHFGEFTGYKVRQFSKLIGKDVIVVHQLLKNDIENHEYWLVTSSLRDADPPAGLAEWMQWNTGARTTESGEIVYHYTQLGPLRKELPPEQVPPVDMSNRVRKLSLAREYGTDIITLFHATGAFGNRSKWRVGVSRVEELSHWLPRVGMRCKCVMSTGEVVTYVSTFYSYGQERIDFWETTEEHNESTHYRLEKVNDNRTRLTIDVYAPKKLPASFDLLSTKRKRMQRDLIRSMENLDTLIGEIKR